jgi:hypothetical protein
MQFDLLDVHIVHRRLIEPPGFDLEECIRIFRERTNPDPACNAVSTEDKAYLCQIVGDLHPGCILIGQTSNQT